MRYRRSSKKRSSLGNARGVLYTVNRTPASESEFENIDRARKKKSSPIKSFSDKLREMLNALGKDRKRLKNRCIAQSIKRQVAHAPEEITLPAVRDNGSGAKKLNGKKRTWFYAGLSTCVFAAVCAAALASLGVFSPKLTTVKINDAGRIVYANTSEDTVGEMLEKNGIALDDSDVLEVSLSAPVEENMEVVIRRAATLEIVDSDETVEVKMLAGTVGEALERAGVVLGSMDEVYPSLDTYIYAGLAINIIRVEVKYTTETEVLAYKEITKNTNKYAKGKKVVAVKGEEGSQENTIEIVIKNGEEYSRSVIETKVVKEPVDEVIYVGTYVAPKVNTGASNPKDDSGKITKAPSIEQIHTGTWAEHRKVAAPSESLIAKTVVADTVTAYTHTGNKTATGTWPRIGTIAANPKQVRYGTKLYIPGYGYGRVEDTGANRHVLSKYFFDVFLETKSECSSWGRKRNWKVYILK